MQPEKVATGELKVLLLLPLLISSVVPKRGEALLFGFQNAWPVTFKYVYISLTKLTYLINKIDLCRLKSPLSKDETRRDGSNPFIINCH